MSIRIVFTHEKSIDEHYRRASRGHHHLLKPSGEVECRVEERAVNGGEGPCCAGLGLDLLSLLPA